MKRIHLLQRSGLNPSRNGNILVGCLVALGIAIVLAIITTVFVITSWRSWTATGTTKLLTKILDETQISEIEQIEIITHIDTLMDRFVAKEISLNDLETVVQEVFQGPLLPAGIVAASYEGYFADSELDDEAKAQAKIQLGRVAHGIYTQAISKDELHDILEPLNAPASPGAGVQVHTNGQNFNLKDPDDVTVEELTELIANAKSAADLAEIAETAPMIDLSDEIAKAIAIALGEDETPLLEPAEDEDIEP